MRGEGSQAGNGMYMWQYDEVAGVTSLRSRVRILGRAAILKNL